MEKIIEGKIEYESKKYGFYYTNNILTLIPDERLVQCLVLYKANIEIE